MSNGKTFVKITNAQVWEQLCNLTSSNEKSHDEIKVALELNKVLLNDHLHGHKRDEIRSRWIWGIIITVVGIIAGIMGSLL